MEEETETLLDRLYTTFISLRNPNFRIYFAAQFLSNVGTRVQIAAENCIGSRRALTNEDREPAQSTAPASLTTALEQ